MKRRAFIQSTLGLGLAAQASSGVASSLHWQSTTFTGLGTTLSIRAAHSDVQRLEAALAAARACVAHVEDQMSLFRPASAICQLNREGELLQPHPDLHHVLSLSQQIAARSRGAFDVTVQPLWALYARAQKQGRLPTSAEIQATRQLVGWQHLEVQTQRIAFKRAGMAITLNGIAQGFAADRVRDRLQDFGVVHALINTGEWSALGQAPQGRDWVLGLADPHQSEQMMARIRMQGLCVATSADDQCTFSQDRKHHHILNPVTGYSPSDVSSVSVVGPSCVAADALTKVVFVAGYDHALRVAASWRMQALVVHKDGRWKATPALAEQLLT